MTGHDEMTELAALYLAVGGLSVALGVVRHRYDFTPRPVTILRSGGPARRYENYRGVTENVAAILFDLLLWPAQVLFWFVFVPIHDLLTRGEK